MARILIVDDSPTQTLSLAKILKKNGHDVMTAKDGAEGVEVAKAELPDLVLMDVVMPKINGFQATRQITKNPSTSHIPVIIVTTKDQETDKIWGERQGAKGYVVKPVEEAMLLETINPISSQKVIFAAAKPFPFAAGSTARPAVFRSLASRFRPGGSAGFHRNPPLETGLQCRQRGVDLAQPHAVAAPIRMMSHRQPPVLRRLMAGGVHRVLQPQRRQRRPSPIRPPGRPRGNGAAVRPLRRRSPSPSRSQVGVPRRSSRRLGRAEDAPFRRGHRIQRFSLLQHDAQRIDPQATAPLAGQVRSRNR